jgi:hypothetical protein
MAEWSKAFVLKAIVLIVPGVRIPLCPWKSINISIKSMTLKLFVFNEVFMMNLLKNSEFCEGIQAFLKRCKGTPYDC